MAFDPETFNESGANLPQHDDAFDMPAAPAPMPGKRTRTQGMSPSLDCIADRVATVLQRRAENDGAPATAGADAESAVSRASSASGTPLPENVRNQFEGSLGADLSAVRVHTGEESAAAAKSVGAQAYATGNDIHFAAGKYQPDDPFGLHLLAHEVAHTVQQSGGGMPARQHKLAMSSSGDAAELEADRAADAMVVGAPASVSGGGGFAIARKPEKPPAKHEGAAPDGVFDPNDIPPATRQAIDQLTLDALRPLVMANINHAYTNFLDACSQMMIKLQKKKEDREKAEQGKMDILIGAVGLMLGPAGAAIGGAVSAKLADPGMQKMVEGKIVQILPAALNKGGASSTVTINLTEMATKKATEIMKGVTAEKATGIVGSAAAKAAAVMGKVDLAGSDEDKAVSYVKAMKENADMSSQALIDSVGTSADIPSILAVYAKFGCATLPVYLAEVETKAMNFMTQVASTVGPGHKSQIVSIDAYGRERLANVRYLSSSATYSFHSWVTPDMEPMVRANNPNPLKIAASTVVGHLPEPTQEGASFGQEQILRVHAWNRSRLVVVKGEKSFFGSRELVFVRWIAPDEEAQAIVKGGAQIGGITDIDGSKIHGMQKPEDPQPPPAAPTPAPPPASSDPAPTN